MLVGAGGNVDWAGIATLVAALGTTVVAVVGAFAAAYVKIKRELAEIRTNTAPTNGKPIPRLIEEAESRRISRIPHDNRTDDEQRHLDVIPPPARPGRDAYVQPIVDRQDGGE